MSELLSEAGQFQAGVGGDVGLFACVDLCGGGIRLKKAEEEHEVNLSS